MEKSRSSSNDTSSHAGRKSCCRGHWRPAEDDKLWQLVDQHGPQNWNFIAEHFDGRSGTLTSTLSRDGKSCRLRWYNQLDPNITKKPFTEEEEEKLLRYHRFHGNKWALIARHFRGRTDNAVKNQYHVIMARRKRERLNLFGKLKITAHDHQDKNHGNYNHTSHYGMINNFNPSLSSCYNYKVFKTTGEEIGKYGLFKFGDHGYDHDHQSVKMKMMMMKREAAATGSINDRFVTVRTWRPLVGDGQQEQGSNNYKNIGSIVKYKNVPNFIDFLGVGSS